MVYKMITLRKISTGGILRIHGKSAKDIIKSKALDPLDWEEVKPEPESEVEESGYNQGDGREEGN